MFSYLHTYIYVVYFILKHSHNKIELTENGQNVKFCTSTHVYISKNSNLSLCALHFAIHALQNFTHDDTNNFVAIVAVRFKLTTNLLVEIIAAIVILVNFCYFLFFILS